MRSFSTIAFVIILAAAMADASPPKSKPWTVKNIEISGNTAFPKSRIQALMKTKPSGIFRHYPYSYPVLVNDLYAVDAFYRQRGYLDASTTISSIVEDSVKHMVTISLRIDEGALTAVDSVAFWGSRLFNDSALGSFIPLKPGNPLDSAAIDTSGRIIADSLRNRGRLFAEVNHTTETDSARHTSVTFDIADGPLVRAGDYEIIGLTGIRPVTVLRELTFDSGDVLTRKEISRSQQRILATGLFESVYLEPQDTSTTGAESVMFAPVLIQVKTGNLSFIDIEGGGGSYERFYVRGGVSYRNLFGLGHRIALAGTVSSPERAVNLSYSYPWIFSIPLFSSFTAYLERRDQADFSGLFHGGAANFNYQFSQRLGSRSWTKFERANWLQQPPATPAYPHLPVRNTLRVGSGIIFDSRMNAIHPGRALFFDVNGELAGFGITSVFNNFYKLTADIRGYFPLPRNALELSSALYAGQADGFGADWRNVPPQERFYIGLDGVRPVRGYDTRDVSPRDENGTVRGGDFVLIANAAEMRFPLYRWFSGAAFFEGGRAFRNAGEFVFSGLKWGAGVSIHVQLPMGLVRIDYGFPFAPEFNIKGLPYLDIGLPF